MTNLLQELAMEWEEYRKAHMHPVDPEGMKGIYEFIGSAEDFLNHIASKYGKKD